MIDRSIIPETKPTRDLKFPVFDKITLCNGIKVYLVKDNRYPVTTLRLLLKAGSYCDFFTKGYKSGLSTLTGELLTKGTRSMNALEISEKIDFAGALLASGFGYDGSFLSISSLNSNLDDMISLSSDFLLNSTFPEDELESKKEQIVNSIISLQDDGSYLAERVFKNIHYKNTPYQFDADGYIDSINQINSDDLKNFSDKYYIPSNIVIAVVGDFNPGNIKEKLESKFINVPKDKNDDNFEFSENDMGKGVVYLTHKDEASQTSLHIGHSGITRNNSDYLNVSFLNTLLGGSFTSRINKNLREKNGLTYGARSSFNSRMYSGDFSVETEINSDKSGFAVDEILYELNDIRENFVTDEELENTKNYIIGNYPLQLETANSVSGKLMTLELYGLDINYYDLYLSRINSITKELVRDTARKYIHPDKLKFVAAGDIDKMKKQLSKFGDIEIIDKVI